MTDKLKQLLQVSAKLYEYLGEIPTGEKRNLFVEEINNLLDERGNIINQLQELNYHYNHDNKIQSVLAELDKGIKNRLMNIMTEIKLDMKNLQSSKKNEQQYMNPYADVRIMDGMYYDKKK